MDTHHLLPPPHKRIDIPIVKRHRYFALSGIVLSLIMLFLSLNLVFSRTSWFGRAQTPGSSGTLSLENSYVFASPISANADGTSIIRITVFLLTSEGLGISGQRVEVNSSAPLQITEVQAMTDTFGRATFDVTSNNRGDYTISAKAQAVTLPQRVSVSFQ